MIRLGPYSVDYKTAIVAAGLLVKAVYDLTQGDYAGAVAAATGLLAALGLNPVSALPAAPADPIVSE